VETTLREILIRLQCIEESLSTLIEKRPSKKYFSTAEIAKLLGRAHWTVRQWARLGRIHAEKRGGRGKHGEWVVSHEELNRLASGGGLLPLPK
jgi:hypothetical protein